MGYTVTTPPIHEPVTLAEAKEHLNVDFTEDDTLIGSMITAARIAVETYLTQKLVTQTITEYFDEFPESGVFELTFWPVQSITSIGYTDTDGDSQTWSSANYQSDLYGLYGNGPARVSTAYSVTYPSTREELNAVNVVYVAGYGSRDEVPELIKRAILLIVSDLYDNRTNQVHTMQTKWQHLLNVGGYKKVL